MRGLEDLPFEETQSGNGQLKQAGTGDGDITREAEKGGGETCFSLPHGANLIVIRAIPKLDPGPEEVVADVHFHHGFDVVLLKLPAFDDPNADL